MGKECCDIGELETAMWAEKNQIDQRDRRRPKKLREGKGLSMRSKKKKAGGRDLEPHLE